ncbi:Uu.00g056030.m01.CDS01 [Anthostomella pinea]|uniref:Uu.00g056030.m01.CDS01 n=1 Tax=Anthostomella pinea TaxID=933095 RepID=A0AAI8YPR2_9PEZI|nr:Uu.00g056030.m01.CDS01 [Anthostomella pinea]
MASSAPVNTGDGRSSLHQLLDKRTEIMMFKATIDVSRLLGPQMIRNFDDQIAELDQKITQAQEDQSLESTRVKTEDNPQQGQNIEQAPNDQSLDPAEAKIEANPQLDRTFAGTSEPDCLDQKSNQAAAALHANDANPESNDNGDAASHDSYTTDSDADDPNDGDFDPNEVKVVKRREIARDSRTAHERENRKFEKELKFPGTHGYEDDQQGEKRPPQHTNLGPRKRRAGQADTGTVKFAMVNPRGESVMPTDLEANPIVAADTTTREALREQLMATSKDIHLTKAGWNELNKAARLMGLNNCKPQGDKWSLKNFKLPMYHHQLLGADFMLRREMSRFGPNGGINADTMGLGKTAQTLATIVANHPQPADLAAGRKITLWLSPSGSTKQLINAVGKFTDLKAIIYDRQSLLKTRGRDLRSCLEENDIVIATYEALLKDFVNATQAKYVRSGNWSIEELHKNYSANLDDLFKTKFYRLVCDEAHRVVNYKTQTHLAAYYIDAQYRWMLTGTPILNSLNGKSRVYDVWNIILTCFAELWGYLSLIRAPWITTFKHFVKDFVKKKYRLDRMVQEVAIRRDLRDEIMGLKFFELAADKREVMIVSPGKHEKPIIKAFERLFRAYFNTQYNEDEFEFGQASASKGKSGTKGYKPKRNLTHILRLREMCSTLFSMKSMMQNAEDCGAVEEVIQDLKFQPGENPWYDWLVQLRSYYHKAAAGQEPAISQLCELCNQESEQTLKIQVNFPGVLEAVEASKCPQCHIEDSSFRTQVHDMTFAAVMRRDLVFKSPHGQGSGRKGVGDGGKRPGVDFYGRMPRCQVKSPVFAAMDSGDFEGLEEAKTTAIVGCVRTWLAEVPDDKIIIFEQFTEGCISIGRALDSIGVNYAYYVGDFQTETRQQIVEDFEEKDDVQVLVMSIKCGGEALNLQRANRVIVAEPWWNACVEEQAFGRVFRLGQEKDTYLMRILLKGSIETRMTKLRNNKANAIAKMLQESVPIQKDLSPGEIADYFGRATEDKDGRLVVESDDEDGEDDE